MKTFSQFITEAEKGNKGRLQQFYKKRGFKRNKDLAISDTHILNP
jgi:hypothetical protein